VPGCREIEALKVLLKRKQDVWVVLELDAAQDGMRQSIELLKNLLKCFVTENAGEEAETDAELGFQSFSALLANSAVKELL
jgi:hypothetical protein